MAELRGRTPCLWIGEDDTGACLKLDDRCGDLRNAVRDGEPAPSEVNTLADAVYEAAREELQELELPSPASLEGAVLYGIAIVVAIIMFLALVVGGAKIALAIGGLKLTFGAAAAGAS